MVYRRIFNNKLEENSDALAKGIALLDARTVAGKVMTSFAAK